MSRPVERTGKLHLLVVDEDAAIRSACCEIAADLGFVPQTVSSIEAARTLLRDQGIDILLLDLRSPLEEGLGTIADQVNGVLLRTKLPPRAKNTVIPRSARKMNSAQMT